jgi:addiction module RelE/StbE family toxin
VKKAFAVKLTSTAQSDIARIWEYIAQDSPLAANDFIDQIESRVFSLSDNPERQPVIPESEHLHTLQYRHLVYKDYRIIYRVQSNEVFVMRIFHGSKLLDLSMGTE